MRDSTLHFVRESAGLGSPPTAFYTNHSVSINALLKESLHYKKHQWGVFNEKIRAVVMQQQKEMEKSIIGYGSIVCVLNTHFWLYRRRNGFA